MSKRVGVCPYWGRIHHRSALTWVLALLYLLSLHTVVSAPAHVPDEQDAKENAFGLAHNDGKVLENVVNPGAENAVLVGGEEEENVQRAQVAPELNRWSDSAKNGDVAAGANVISGQLPPPPPPQQDAQQQPPEQHENSTGENVQAQMAEVGAQGAVEKGEKKQGGNETEQQQSGLEKVAAQVMKSKEALKFKYGVMELLTMKEHVSKQLGDEGKQLEGNGELDAREKALERSILAIKQQQLDLTEQLVVQAMESLQQTVEGDWNTIKENGWASLHTIQDAVLQIQQRYKELLGKAEQLQKSEGVAVTGADQEGANKGLVKDTLEVVANAADDVESKMKEDKFDEAHKMEGAQIDMVVVLDDDHGEGNESPKEKKPDESKPHHLVDSNNNEYVLTRSHDATTHYEDHNLLNDIILMMSASFVGGALFHLLRMPSFFGFMAAGITVGPVGFNWIHSVVQLETIAQFGIFFILFVLGLEFSLDKLRQTFRVSVWGSAAMLVADTACIAMVTWLTGQPLSTSILVGGCLCLSSTAVVLKVLSAEELESTYGRNMVGILVMQDIYFGLMITLMPLLGGDSTASEAVWMLLSLVQSLVLFGLLCYIVSHYCMSSAIRLLMGTRSEEIVLLGTLGLCFATLKVTEHLGLSMEMGCFAAGVLISNTGIVYATAAIEIMEPVRDLFAALFFCTIGLHVYPSFLWSQWRLLCLMTLSTVALKFFIGYAILHRLFGQTHILAALSSLGLSQISEFAFVLASRGKSIKVIPREVYYLLLGTTTLSLVLVPLLFGLTRSALRAWNLIGPHSANHYNQSPPHANRRSSGHAIGMASMRTSSHKA